MAHLWVEQSFEFFAAAISAYLLMAVGLVSRQLAERSVYLELILIFLGGVLGTGHHLYWAGPPRAERPYSQQSTGGSVSVVKHRGVDAHALISPSEEEGENLCLSGIERLCQHKSLPLFCQCE